MNALLNKLFASNRNLHVFVFFGFVTVWMILWRWFGWSVNDFLQFIPWMAGLAGVQYAGKTTTDAIEVKQKETGNA